MSLKPFLVLEGIMAKNVCLTCSLPVSIKNEYDILGEKYSECHEILHVSAVIPVI